MDDKIDKYKQNLYSRKRVDTTERDLENISTLKKQKDRGLENNWKSVSERLNENTDLYKYEQNETSIFSIIFFIALSFFMVSVGVASFFLYFQKNDIPLNQMQFSLIAPNSVDSGDVLEYTLEFENNTDYKFENVEVFVKYPKGSLSEEDKLSREKDLFEIGDILSGGKNKIKKGIILAGSPNEKKNIEISVNYQLEGYSSILNQRKDFSVKIDSAPVFVKINMPKDIMSQEEFDINIEILSNSNAPLENIVLIGKYPNGFEIIENNPDAIYSTNYKNIFVVNSLKIGEKKEIKIRAKLIGENAETKVLSFAVGNSTNDSNEIKTEYFNAKEKIIIKKPGLDLKLLCKAPKHDSNDDVYVFEAGKSMSCNIQLRNNLVTKVADIGIKMHYQDDLILEKKLKSKDSYIDSNNNFILWNKNTMSELSVLKGGESLTSEFEWDYKSVSDLAGYVKNPETLLDFTLTGTNFEGENSVGNVKNTIEKSIQLNTDIILESEVNYTFDESDQEKWSPFENYGGPNPKVGDKVTYAITWKIYNSTNKLEDIKVVGKLPVGVIFENTIYPEGNYVSFDEKTREVKWSIKSIEPYIGYRTNPKTMTFKVGYIPNLSDKDLFINLVGEKRLTAKDYFTKKTINVSLRGDTSMVKGEGGKFEVFGKVE